MNTIPFTLATTGKTLYTSDVLRITVMTKSGEITILPGHIPLVTVVVPGELTIETSNGIMHFFVGQGVLSLDKEQCTILSSVTELSDDIDIDLVNDAIRRAAEYSESQSDKNDREYARLQAQIERDLARVRVKTKWSTERF